MTPAAIRRAFEVRMQALPTIPTAYEGVTFQAPAGLHQILTVIPVERVSPGYNRASVVDHGLWRVLTKTQPGKGTKELADRVALVVDQFTPASGTLFVDGIELDPPRVGGVLTDDVHIGQLVEIRYRTTR